MKPNFALNLSHEGICLLRRAKDGWSVVGEVHLDSPDLNLRLAELRQHAEALEPQALTCKLVVPNSQILYTAVDAPGPSDKARAKQIRSALEGLTPYDPKDLVFDWRAEGGAVQVAVVARETLREAETFAAEFKFNPVCFVAMATPENFDGEPFFGPTELAPSLIGASTKIERDEIGIEIAPRTRPIPLAAKLTLPKEPPAAAEPPASAVEENAGTPAKKKAEKPAANPADKKSDGQADTQADKRTDKPIEVLPAAKANAKSEAKPSRKRSAKPAAKTEPPTEQSAPGASMVAPTIAEPGTQGPSRPFGQGAPEPEPAQPVAFASSRVRARTIAPLPEVAAPHEPRLDPLPPAAAPQGAPASLAEPSLGEDATRAGGPAFTALDLYDVPDMPAWRKTLAGAEQPAVNGGSVPGDLPLIVDDAVADPALGPASEPATGAAGGLRINGAVVATRVAKPAAAGVPHRLRSRKEAIAASSREAKSMAILGERDAPTVGGKPRYLGLALTVLLLMAFGVAALWSSLFVDDASGTSGTGAIAAINPVEPIVTEPIAPVPEAPAATEAPAVAPAAAPSIADTAPEVTEPALGGNAPVVTAAPSSDTATLGSAIDGALSEALELAPSAEIAPPVPQVAAPLTLPSQELAPESAPSATVEVARLDEPLSSLPGTAPPPDRVSEAPPSRAEAERRYAISGIWQLDPVPLDEPAAAGQSGDVLVASVDPSLGDGAPGALRGTAPDQRPQALLPPRPLRSSFDLDARGLIPATPEGNVSPDGTLVFLGRPPVVPGVRPGTVAPQPEPGPEAAPDPAALVQPDGTASDGATEPPPAAAEPAPIPEPAPILEPAPPEEAAPPPLTPEQERLREVRPPVRPSSFEETFNQSPDEEGFSPEQLALIRPSLRPPSVQEEVASEEVPVIDEEEASDLAIAASASPRGRPAAVERRAEAVSTARREAEEEAASSNVGPPVQVAAAVVPRTPSRASVAREATEKNVLNLNRVNLIGVYGSSSDRRALVRLRSGRYVKVEVGDRVDGGRVAAIGSDELRYVKGGRNITLKLPRG